MRGANLGEEQNLKTKNIFREISMLSGKNWKELYYWLDLKLPGVVSGESHMRQLGAGNRSISDEKLAVVAKLALHENIGGNFSQESAEYIPLSDEEIKELKKRKRSQRYLSESPKERLIDGPMRDASAERRRCAAKLDEALSTMASAGYSCVDVLYMVNSWLIKTPPKVERGSRQNWLVSAPEELGNNTFSRAFYPESLPRNFVLPEHLDGMPYFIECSVRSLKDTQVILPVIHDND